MQPATQEKIPEQGHGFVERFKEGVNIVSHGISDAAQNLREKIWPLERPNPEKDLDPTVRKQNELVFAQINKLPHKNERVIQTDGKASEEDIKRFLERGQLFNVHNLSEKLHHGFENLAAKFSHTDKPVHHEDAPTGFVEYAPTETVTKKQLGEFHEVKEGFKQTIPELQQERKEGQPKLDKTNPFDAFNDENVNAEQRGEGKTLTEKMKGSITEAKDKVLHAFGGERSQNTA